MCNVADLSEPVEEPAHGFQYRGAWYIPIQYIPSPCRGVAQDLDLINQTIAYLYIHTNVNCVPGRIRYTAGVLCYKCCMDDRPGFTEADGGR